MRPGTSNNNSGKSSCALAIQANNTFNHFRCCYHGADGMCKFYAVFMKMLIRACYEAFVIMAEMKGVPRQRIRKCCHDNISVPVAHGDTGAKGKVTGVCHARMLGCSRLPDVPHDGGKAWQSATCNTTS